MIHVYIGGKPEIISRSDKNGTKKETSHQRRAAG